VSSLPDSTMFLGRLFQSPVTLIKIRMFETVDSSWYKEKFIRVSWECLTYAAN